MNQTTPIQRDVLQSWKLFGVISPQTKSCTMEKKSSNSSALLFTDPGPHSRLHRLKQQLALTDWGSKFEQTECTLTVTTHFSDMVLIQTVSNPLLKRNSSAHSKQADHHVHGCSCDGGHGRVLCSCATIQSILSSQPLRFGCGIYFSCCLFMQATGYGGTVVRSDTSDKVETMEPDCERELTIR